MPSPNLASRRWIWEQYDSQLGADTVQRPGGDAAVVRVHGSKKALAITTDCTPRYCYADPVEGGKQAVAEAYRNLCAVGARPLAITNCLNFGNPQRPEIMGQFVGCVEGMAEACRALDFPVVSGNVSLYNETKAEDGSSLAILPTPAIGGVGLLDDWEKSATIGFKAQGERIFCVNNSDRTSWGHLGQSLWLREIHNRADGPPPRTDLHYERQNAAFVREAIELGLVSAVHDISDGGLAVALAEMALAGNIGAALSAKEISARWAFGEDQGEYLLTVPANALDRFEDLRLRHPVFVEQFGVSGGEALTFEEFVADDNDEVKEISRNTLADLRAAHEGFFPGLMRGELAVG
jgi:phosphoribosylformylglycinamidine synthase